MDIAFCQSQIKNTVYTGSTNTIYQCRFSKKSFITNIILERKFGYSEGLTTRIIQKVFQKRPF